MPGVERKGDLATCDHANTGSDTVFANGKGITRVGIDTAGGLINGGSDSVFVEGYKVSLPGDLIDTHGPDGSHAAETTENESQDVLCGDGGDPAPDLDLTLDAIGGGGPYYTNTKNPPGSGSNQNCWWYTGDVTFSYTVTNNSSVPVGPFNIGLWEMDWFTNIGQTFYWVRGDDGKYDGKWPILRGEVRQGVIPAGAQVTGTLVLPSDPQTDKPGIVPPHDLGILNPHWSIVTSSHPRGFTMHADIDKEVKETDEKNSVPVIEVGAIYDANGCT